MISNSKASSVSLHPKFLLICQGKNSVATLIVTVVLFKVIIVDYNMYSIILFVCSLEISFH